MERFILVYYFQKNSNSLTRSFELQIVCKQLSSALLLSLLVACQNFPQSSPLLVLEPAAEPPNAEAVNVSRAGNTSSTARDEAIVSTMELEKSYDDLWERVRDGFQLGTHYDHPKVASYIQSYSKQQRYFDLMQERASPFLFSIVEEIERRGLPMEFTLLPMVESTYNPNAYSREHAVGLWQFVGATGKSFGLQQDWWFDGRRDPRASTIAALDYMEQLYNQFDEDWLLAIAAYNTGDGNLRRAIRRSNEDEIEFWNLNLPGETKAHVPKLLALAAIISDHNAWEIELQNLPNAPVLRAVEIGTQIDISQAATLAEIDYKQLRALNPGYLQWATHPDQPQRLLLPFDNAELLENALVGLDKRDLLTWDRYEIKPGDTLGAIAAKLNTRVDILQTFNSLPGSRIVAGDSLLIPRTSDPQLLATARQIDRNQGRERIKVPSEYTVRNGDNLWTIARRFELRSKEIATWNRISLDELLQPGQVLDFRYALKELTEESEMDSTDDAAVYIVRRGDSMDAIANRFGIDLQNLLRWNGLRVSELIFPGQELQVMPDTMINERL